MHPTTPVALSSLCFVSLAWAASALLACGGGGVNDASGAADPGPGTGGEQVATLEELARRAVSADGDEAEGAIAALRAAGPAGHAALSGAHATSLELLRTSPPTSPDAALERLRHAMDVVSGQRDGHASGLYWHTDLDAAERESRATGRPILSLRLLGRLDEELSCANSRYFRLVLYANRELSDYLRAHYVLHWSSERPVPRITIDMGDGRVLERTITGNSIHYVLDAEGRVLDAMPGLHGPREFLRFARAAEEAHAAYGGLRPSELGVGPAALTAHRSAALRTATAELDRARVAFLAVPEHVSEVRPVAVASALAAMALTVSKVAVEAPMLDALRAPGIDPTVRGVIDWPRVAMEAYGRDLATVLDAQSRALLRLKTGRDEAASAELVTALSRTVVGDSALNDATFRLHVLEWLRASEGGGEPAPTLATFNERIYGELFLTPASDPWLGLQDPTVWDAIERLH